MTIKILPFLKKYVWLITTIVAVSGFFLSVYQARVSAKSPVLKYYVVKVSPEVNDSDLQTARQKIENSLFQSVNNLIGKDSSLTYSGALNQVLPLSESVGNISGGVVIVIQNQGENTADNLRINLKSETPIGQYQIISNEKISIVDESKENGTLKFDVDRLTSNDNIQIAILFPGAYAVFVRVARTYSTNRPDFINGSMTFYTTSNLDNIQTTVFVSSDEVQGEIDSSPSKDTSKERFLFFNTFQP